MNFIISYPGRWLNVKNDNHGHATYFNCHVLGNLEWVIAKQLHRYLQDNASHDVMQSAYHPNHSTETALIKTHNHIFMALDGGEEVILCFLDLSCAFGTINHRILLDRSDKRFGMWLCCRGLLHISTIKLRLWKLTLLPPPSLPACHNDRFLGRDCCPYMCYYWGILSEIITACTCATPMTPQSYFKVQ
jgi:hypothetical protein